MTKRSHLQLFIFLHFAHGRLLSGPVDSCSAKLKLGENGSTGADFFS